MKIAIVGTINYDTIINIQGERIESFGGILYNTLALAHLSPSSWRIFPIAWIGSDRIQELKALLASFPNLNLRGIKENPEGTNENYLFYYSEVERREILTSRVPPLEFEQIQPFLDSELILVNFISGFDLNLKTLKKLRAQFGGILFLDLHSLGLGMDKKGRRFWKKIENWEEWVKVADIIQMNEREAKLLNQKEDLSKFGEQILKIGPSILLITLGEKGSFTFVAEEGKIHKFYSPSTLGEVIDPTGC